MAAMNSVVHFEMPAKDKARVAKFGLIQPKQ